MHHPTDRIVHTTVKVTPIVEYGLEWEVAQWIHHEGLIWWPISPWANALPCAYKNWFIMSNGGITALLIYQHSVIDEVHFQMLFICAQSLMKHISKCYLYIQSLISTFPNVIYIYSVTDKHISKCYLYIQSLISTFPNVIYLYSDTDKHISKCYLSVFTLISTSPNVIYLYSDTDKHISKCYLSVFRHW